MSIDDTTELRALQKALITLKFGNDPNEAAALATSPLLGNLLKRTAEEICRRFDREIDFSALNLPDQYIGGVIINISGGGLVPGGS